MGQTNTTISKENNQNNRNNQNIQNNQNNHNIQNIHNHQIVVPYRMKYKISYCKKINLVVFVLLINKNVKYIIIKN